MKTNAEWYLMMPEPYRFQAITNAEREGMLGNKASSLAAALCAFPWELTRPGYDYWQAIFVKARDGMFDIPVPDQ